MDTNKMPLRAIYAAVLHILFCVKNWGHVLCRAFTATSSQGSQSSSGLSGGMAWAFQDPEHGSSTSKASGAPTTTFVNPEYQPLATNRSHVSHSQTQLLTVS